MVYVTPPTVPVSPTSAPVHTTVTPFATRRKSATVTVAVMLADPDVAVIVAVPVATGLTSPAYDTVATAAADVLHVTVAPLIVAPFWSLTVAVFRVVIRVVSPKEAKLRLVAESVIDVATGVGSVGLPSPPQLAKSSEDKLHATIFLMP